MYQFVCNECGLLYKEFNVPDDKFCSDEDCLFGKLIPCRYPQDSEEVLKDYSRLLDFMVAYPGLSIVQVRGRSKQGVPDGMYLVIEYDQEISAILLEKIDTLSAD